MKPALAITVVLALVPLLAACSSGSDPGASSVATEGAPAASSSDGASASFPTGPALLVASDYQAPKNRVDSTGAFLPANGKPTIVWSDAIW